MGRDGTGQGSGALGRDGDGTHAVENTFDSHSQTHSTLAIALGVAHSRTRTRNQNRTRTRTRTRTRNRTRTFAPHHRVMRSRSLCSASINVLRSAFWAS